MNWQQAIERTVTGLGYDLVDVERAAAGLLRVTIDRVPGRVYPSRDGLDMMAGPAVTDDAPTGAASLAPQADDADEAAGGEAAGGDAQDAELDDLAVTVEDCARVTRQLQYALEVEAVDYQRLEVSSPGLDRPLKREDDFRRFAGQEASITLKLPFQGRKVWRGVLQAEGAGWRLVLSEGKGGRTAKAGDGEQVLDFSFDEVREAKLVPVLDFRGRGGQSPDGASRKPSRLAKQAKQAKQAGGHKRVKNAKSNKASAAAAGDAGVNGGQGR